MSKIILPAIMASYRQLKDYSWSVTFNTGELTDEQLLIVRSMYQAQCIILIRSGNKLDQQEESILDDLQIGKKPQTPSQILRFVLSQIYEKKHKESPGYKDKEDFYQKTMEEVINHFKSKLNV